MPTIDQYGEPTPGGFGPGNLLGLAASASAADYFLLRARSFSKVATQGVPQGIFGLRAVGRRMSSMGGSTRAFSNPYMSKVANATRPILGGLGGFLSGEGKSFGMFDFNSNSARYFRGGQFHAQMFTSGELKKIRVGIARSKVSDLIFNPTKTQGYKIFEEAATGSGVSKTIVTEAQRRFVVSSRLAGIGRVMGGVLPVVRAAIAAKLAIDLAGFAGKVVGSAIGAVTRGVGPTMTSYRGLEFGGPTQVFQMGTAVTERQRALAEIQRSHSNSRFLFGNEAAMYSQS